MTNFILKRNGLLCDICISEDAPNTAITAAGELVRCLGKDCEWTSLIRYGVPNKGEICLGAKSAECELEELRITVEDDILWLDGGTRGILYATYELMERLGYRFFAEDCEVFPEAEELSVPADMKVQQKPVFEYRCAYWKEVNMLTAPKMRLNRPVSGEIPALWGGSVDYEGHCHTLGDLAEMEPIDGHFVDRQPCLTDEKTFQTVVKNLRERLKKNPNAAIASVSQNDSFEEGRGCTCPACKALDDAEGTPMGSLLTFVNRVAEELGPEFPNVAFDTLAYRYTRKVPANLCARDNVIIRLCSIECCFSHPIDECNQVTQEVEDGGFADTLRKWSKHSNRIYIWDYTTNFCNYNACFPNFAVLRQNLRFFAENNVQGVFEQGNYESLNGEFAQLRIYLLSKLLWDPYMDEETYRKHMDEFMTAYYGAGAPMISRFLNRLQTSAKDVHFGIYFNDPTQLFVDPEISGSHEERVVSFLKKGRADFAAAKREANAVQLAHIRRSEIQLDVYEWYWLHNKLEGIEKEHPEYETVKADLYTAGATLYANVVSSGIMRMHEGWGCLNSVPDYLQEPCTWK